MATGTNGIATRANANSLKPGSYTTDLSRCITYASAKSAGFIVKDDLNILLTRLLAGYYKIIIILLKLNVIIYLE